MNQSGLSSIERSTLIALHRLTQVVEPDQWHSTREVAEAVGVRERDAAATLEELRALGLSKPSGRSSGGWRTSARGDELAHRSIESMTSGRDRQEHTMREILRLGGDRPFGPGEWQSWDLHADGAPVVAVDERIRALAALERLGYLAAKHSWQMKYFRCEVTPLGVDVLSRPDISLADRALGQGQPAAVMNIDQRVGVLAHTVTNHGALQVGDNNTQTVTLTAEQSSRLLSQLPELRELISAVNLPHEISDRLESDLHELEQVAEHGGGVGRARALLGDMVQASAVAASTDAGQRLGALLFSLMGGLA